MCTKASSVFIRESYAKYVEKFPRIFIQMSFFPTSWLWMASSYLFSLHILPNDSILFPATIHLQSPSSALIHSHFPYESGRRRAVLLTKNVLRVGGCVFTLPTVRRKRRSETIAIIEVSREKSQDIESLYRRCWNSTTLLIHKSCRLFNGDLILWHIVSNH